MKKFLCLVLLLTLLPIGCLTLVACDKSYNIKEFYSSYRNIEKECPHLILKDAVDSYSLGGENVKLDIDYSQSPQLSALVEDSNSKYHYLKYFYQQLLDDSLSPLYFFGNQISNSKKIGEKKTKQLFVELKNLENCYEDIDYYTGALMVSLKSVNDENVSLSYLKKLFEKYESAITVAGTLSAVINDVYFNNVVSISNIDYSSKTFDQLTDTDLTAITLNVRSKMYYYKSIYANVYTQLYVREADLANKLVYESTTPPSYAPYDYISSILELNTRPIENLRNAKQSIYKNIISLYNIQSNFDEAYKTFNAATQKVAYNQVDMNTSDQTQINYSKMIKQFANGIVVDSYEILNNLINLLYL